MHSFTLLLSSLALTQALPSSPLSTRTISARDSCSKMQQESDGCYTYCSTKTSVINGPAQSASARITCDVNGCTDQKVDTVTVTEGWSVTAGLATGPISSSATFTWSKSVASSNTYTFTLQKGDDGHIMFTPTLNQICGDLAQYELNSITGQHGSSIPYCEDQPGSEKPSKEDTNACGTTAQLLQDGSANGDYTFCSTNGTGCTPLAPVQNKKRSFWSIDLPKPLIS